MHLPSAAMSFRGLVHLCWPNLNNLFLIHVLSSGEQEFVHMAIRHQKAVNMGAKSLEAHAQKSPGYFCHILMVKPTPKFIPDSRDQETESNFCDIAKWYGYGGWLW